MSISTHTVRFDGLLIVAMIPRFSGLVSINKGINTVEREIYGRAYFNDAAYPEGRYVFADDLSGNNHTTYSSPTVLIDGESWYHIFVRGTEDTQILDNAHFANVDGSGNLLNWVSGFPSGAVTGEIVDFDLSDGTTIARNIAHIDTSSFGTAPPAMPLYQEIVVGTQGLEPTTTYTALVWSRVGVSSVSALSVYTGATLIGTDTASVSEWTKLRVVFTTGLIGEVLTYSLDLNIGVKCDFMLANLVEGTNVGLDEGEVMRLKAQDAEGGIISRYAENEDNEDLFIPFIAGSGFNSNDVLHIDLYFNAPSTVVSVLGGEYDVRPMIELILTSSPGEVVDIFYSVNSSPFQLYTVPFVFNQDGLNILRWYSEDARGNREATHEETYFISAPQVQAIPSSGIFGSIQTITFDTNERLGIIYYEFEGIIPGVHSSVFDPGNPIEISSDTTLKYFFEDEYGTVTDVQTDIYVVDTTHPIIERFSINSEVPVTNTSAVILYTQLQGDIPIDRLQFSVAQTSLSLAQLNSGDYQEEVAQIFAGAPYRQAREETSFDLIGGGASTAQTASITVYARAFTYDESSASTLSPIVAASIVLDSRAPFLFVDSIIDRNGDTVAEVSFYNTFSITGRKTSNAQIVMIEGDDEQIIVESLPSNEEWQFLLVLSLGIHNITIVAETELGTRSVPYTFEVTITVPPGVTDATVLVGVGGTWTVPFVLFDKSTHLIPYHTFTVSAATNIGLEPTITSLSEQELVGESILSVSGTAPSESIVTVQINRVR